MSLTRQYGIKRQNISKRPLRRTALRKVGPMQEKWKAYRNATAKNSLDEDGLIKCEDHKMGLPTCGIAREPSQMDLHHIKGRNEAPELYFDRSNLVWLTRECHDEAHHNR